MELEPSTVTPTSSDCGACGTTNPGEANFCKSCGQTLYEKCPECRQKVLLTQKFCASCGTDLEKFQQDRSERHLAWMKEAVECARGHEFERAIGLLQRVIDDADYRFEENKQNALQAIDRVRKLESQTIAQAEKLLVEAKQAYDREDHAETARLLGLIPARLRTPEISSLLSKVSSLHEQHSTLEQELRESLAAKNWCLVGNLLTQLLDLLPDSQQYQQLAGKVARKLNVEASRLIEKGSYRAAVEHFASVPHVARDQEFECLQRRAENIFWMSDQFASELFVTPGLGRLAVRFAKEVPHDRKAQLQVKELATRLKEAPRPPRCQFPIWRAMGSWSGGKVTYLSTPRTIPLADRKLLQFALGKFNIAMGLAIQGLGKSRVTESFVQKKKLLGGIGRRAKRAWGIDVGNASLKAVCMEDTAEGLQVIDAYYQEYPVPICRRGSDVSTSKIVSEAMDAFLKAREIEGASVWVNLGASKVINRFVRLPPVKDKQAATLLQQEADQKIPIDIEDLSLVNWIAELEEDSVSGRPAMVSASRRSVVEERQSLLANSGLTIDGMQSDTNALVNFAAWELSEYWSREEEERIQVQREKMPAVTIFDFGASTTNLILISEHAHWCWTMESGGEDMTARLSRSTKLTHTEAEKVKRNPAELESPGEQYAAVEQRQEEVRRRMETAFAEALKQCPSFQVVATYVCGGAALAHGAVRRILEPQG